MFQNAVRALSAVSILALSSLACAGLAVGDKAPALDKVNWLKGDPAPAWEPGEVYVLDFWATWCGPCVATIPEVTSLQQEHREDGVHVIGVAIWPSPDMIPTADFVREQGDAMDYAIAEDIDGAMANQFMDAAGQNGIPTTMVIDQEGRLAWIGHPMAGLDGVVEQVVAGSWDIEKAAAEFRDAAAAEERQQAEAMALRERVKPLFDRMNTAAGAGDWEGALTALDEIAALDSETLGRLGYSRFDILMSKARIIIDDRMMGDKERGYTLLATMADEQFHDDPYPLNEIAWAIVDPEGSGMEPLDLDLAERAVERANELTDGGDFAILDTYARVRFRQGHVDDAIDLQQQAIEAADDASAKAILTKTLNEYKQAKEQGR